MPKHLISIQQLDRANILQILEQAAHYQHDLQHGQPCRDALPDKIIAHLFFEPSTRTCNSFQIAALRLQAHTLTPSLEASALQKGESVLDTLNNLAAMGVNAFVIRHKEDHLLAWLAEQLKYDCSLISAGEGRSQHPSQALIDVFTISQWTKDWETLSVAIVGDLYHSRVAHSLVDALSILGTRDIRLVCPDVLKPEPHLTSKARLFHQLSEGLHDVDVVVCLRLQKERILSGHLVNETEFFKDFMLTPKTIQYAKPGAIVMHPGPINRDCEIASALADSPQAKILQQVENSVAIRMAILKRFL